MKLLLTSGRTYSAVLKLGFLDSLASNERVAEELAKAGFDSVVVIGAGSERTAKGTWRGPTREVELPKQVVRVY